MLPGPTSPATVCTMQIPGRCGSLSRGPFGRIPRGPTAFEHSRATYSCRTAVTYLMYSVVKLGQSKPKGLCWSNWINRVFYLRRNRVFFVLDVLCDKQNGQWVLCVYGLSLVLSVRSNGRCIASVPNTDRFPKYTDLARLLACWITVCCWDFSSCLPSQPIVFIYILLHTRLLFRGWGFCTGGLAPSLAFPWQPEQEKTPLIALAVSDDQPEVSEEEETQALIHAPRGSGP